MKSILLIIFLVGNCSPKTRPGNSNFSIKIWDKHYSMSYTNMYFIDNDSVIVKYISGVESEGEKILMKRSLSDREAKLITEYLSSINLDSLNSEYNNPLIVDGDVKKIILNFNYRSKTIKVSNAYHKDIAGLINVVNSIVNENLKMEYPDH